MTPKFHFIGWCKEGTHDKIWGYFSDSEWQPDPNKFYQRTPCYIFWGKRGKALNFKHDEISPELHKLADNKMGKKHYRSISQEKLLEIWPTFADDMGMRLMFKLLSNKVM